MRSADLNVILGIEKEVNYQVETAVRFSIS